MEGIEYQKKLADYDEKIDFLKMQIAQIEYERSRFVSSVLDATIKSKNENTQLPSGINIVQGDK